MGKGIEVGEGDPNWISDAISKKAQSRKREKKAKISFFLQLRFSLTFAAEEKGKGDFSIFSHFLFFPFGSTGNCGNFLFSLSDFPSVSCHPYVEVGGRGGEYEDSM